METSSSPDEQYAQVFEQLLAAVGEDAGTVRVKSVTPLEEGDDGTATATATLAWSWPVATKEAWEYETVAQLTYPGATDGEAGQWEAGWNTGVLVPGLEAGERLAVERTEPARGDIVTPTGETIVGMTPVHRVGIDKTRPGWETAAEQLGRVLKFDQATTDGIAAQVAAAGAKAFVEVITIRDNDSEYDFEAAMAINGVVGIPDELSLARDRDFARPLLGTVGEATAEIVEESKGAVKPGDMVGLSGLQAAHDEQLRGVPGLAVTIEPVKGGEGREAFTIDQKDGEPVTISLDPATQLRAEAALADFDDLASAIVAIKPSTGEVLAAASGPGSEGYSTATLGQYAPGPRSRSRRPSRCFVRGSRRTARCPARRASTSGAARSRTSRATSRPRWVTPCRSGRCSPTRATRLSSRSTRRSRSSSCTTPRRRSAWASRPRPSVPGPRWATSRRRRRPRSTRRR